MTLRFLASCLVGILVAAAHSAAADPIAFVANQDSSTVSVVDVTSGDVRSTIRVDDTFLREPQDLAIDPKSGRVFVAGDAQLISFDGRAPDGRGLHRVATRADGSGIAIDDVGRRVFLTHEDGGIVSEFSIADPARPTLIAEHQVPGADDLRHVAWDRRYYRLYVLGDTGFVARTGPGNLSFSQVVNLNLGEGGMLADPAGGVWVTVRRSTMPGKLVRITEGGGVTEYLLPAGHGQPRGMAWDVSTPGTILIAVDDANKIKRFTPSTGLFTDVMNTDLRPQDVGATAGVRVSANRVASGMYGTMTKNGALLATTQEKPVAMAVLDLPRLSADPPAKTFCYNRSGDTGEQTFTIQNTRVDRLSIDLLPVAIGGSNPSNYVLVGTNTCSSQRLTWGQTCTFRVRFTAGGPSIQPPPPFGATWASATWPAEAVVSGTSGSGTTRIPLKGALNLNSCYSFPPLIPLSPTFNFGG